MNHCFRDACYMNMHLQTKRNKLKMGEPGL